MIAFWLLKQQYKAAPVAYFKMTSISPIWWVVFACLQHATGVFWREWQIYGCFMLFYVPEARLSSADKQLEGSMWHLSVFVSFPHCTLHISHSDSDSLMPETRLMCRSTRIWVHFGYTVPASTFSWLMRPTQSMRCTVIFAVLTFTVS